MDKCFSFLFVLTLLAILVADMPHTADAFVRPGGKAGLLKLCPPGGESFATAWQITCGMRRRKKRETEAEEAEASSEFASSTSLNGTKKATNGAEDSAQAIAGAAIINPEPLLKPNPVDSLPSDKVNSGKLHKRSIWSNELLQFDPVGSIGENTNHQKEKEKEEALYRAPSMTEMMMVCCRYGCSLRDLLPYCDPFGQWDS